VKVLAEGTYLSVLINPAIRGARRRAAITKTARQITEGEGESESAPSSIPPRRTWCGWWNTTYPTAKATAPVS
jgi:hypothetical protein